jgi:hypothetical protein
MTETIGRAARAAATPGRETVVANLPDGPVSIEGYYDEAFSVPTPGRRKPFHIAVVTIDASDPTSDL